MTVFQTGEPVPTPDEAVAIQAATPWAAFTQDQRRDQRCQKLVRNGQLVGGLEHEFYFLQ